MAVRQASSGQLELPLAASEAIWLFTPEGERVWVPGWNPVYPAGKPSEEAGTVFVTNMHGVETTWVIVGLDRANATAAYARVTPGQSAGMVQVECTDNHPGHCSVSVSYDITVIGGADESVLDHYLPDRFSETMETWATLIGGYLASSTPGI